MVQGPAELPFPWDGVKDFSAGLRTEASAQMSFSWNVLPLRGLGAQREGQRRRLGSLARWESFWGPASTSATLLINFFAEPGVWGMEGQKSSSIAVGTFV